MDKTTNKELFKLTWPVFVEMLLTVLVGNVDQFMLSQYSQSAVNAVGNSNQILNLMILTFNVINVSTTILVSHYIGSFQEKRAKMVYNLAMVMNTAFGLLISGTLLFFGRGIFTFMNVSEQSLDEAVGYLSVVGGFLFIQGINVALVTILRTRKLMGKAMRVAVLVNLINVLGNCLLIYGVGPFPKMGAVGAGVATVASRAVGLVVYVAYIYRYTDVRLRIKKYLSPFPGRELGKMLGIGLPSAGETISFSLSQAFLVRNINRFGLFVFNTRAYVVSFQWISVIYSVSLSNVAQILVGRALGEGDVEGANVRIRKTLTFSIMMAVIMSTLVYLFARPLISIFTTEEEILSLAKQIFFIEIFLQIGKNANITLVRCLQATGDTKFPIVVGIIVMWLVAAGMGYVLGVTLGMGLVGVWIAMAADELIRGVIFFIRWRSGAWRKYNLVK